MFRGKREPRPAWIPRQPPTHRLCGACPSPRSLGEQSGLHGARRGPGHARPRVPAPPPLTKFLPLKGPSGTYSHFWMSRALQSFTSTYPKMWSAAEVAGMGCPSALPGPMKQPCPCRWSGTAGWVEGQARRLPLACGAVLLSHACTARCPSRPCTTAPSPSPAHSRARRWAGTLEPLPVPQLLPLAAQAAEPGPRAAARRCPRPRWRRRGRGNPQAGAACSKEREPTG